MCLCTRSSIQVDSFLHSAKQYRSKLATKAKKNLCFFMKWDKCLYHMQKIYFTSKSGIQIMIKFEYVTLPINIRCQIQTRIFRPFEIEFRLCLGLSETKNLSKIRPRNMIKYELLNYLQKKNHFKERCSENKNRNVPYKQMWMRFEWPRWMSYLHMNNEETPIFNRMRSNQFETVNSNEFLGTYFQLDHLANRRIVQFHQQCFGVFFLLSLQMYSLSFGFSCWYANMLIISICVTYSFDLKFSRICILCIVHRCELKTWLN